MSDKDINKNRNINKDTKHDGHPQKSNGGGESMSTGYRKPNIDRFMSELGERKKAIDKFDKFVNKSLAVSSKTMKKQIQI